MHHQADQSTQLFISHFRCLNWSTAFHSLADDLHSTNRRLPRCQSNRITFINEFNQSYVSRLTYPPNRVVERFCRSINMRSLTFSSISLYSIVPFLSVHMITIFWRLLTQQLRNVHCGCYQCTWSWLYCSKIKTRKIFGRFNNTKIVHLTAIRLCIHPLCLAIWSKAFEIGAKNRHLAFA